MWRLCCWLFSGHALELRGRFGLPDDIDDSFTTTINLVVEAIAAHPTTATSS